MTTEIITTCDFCGRQIDKTNDEVQVNVYAYAAGVESQELHFHAACSKVPLRRLRESTRADR